MLITTSHTIEGQPIQEYLGIVTGETILGANVFKDIGASFRDVFGGRVGGWEAELRKARMSAMEEMTEAARQIGATAIIAVDVDYETIGSGNTLMVAVAGTAVRL
ncbi:MAG TPA: YbjQ family protein [Thermomicrobiales bacterium]|nr:YbjQ family protein [Thermomicrobiales bacterium]